MTRTKKGARKKKRVAAHIRENQGKRAAAAASGEGEVGADERAPLLAPPLGVGKPKRPREPDAAAQGVAAAARDNPARREKERADANNYLAAWLSVRKAAGAAEEAGTPPPASKGVWKFNKNTQAWLLRNVFSDNQIGEKSFGTLCLYLEGLKGAGRQRVLAAAQEIIDKHGPDEGEEQTAMARQAAREAAEAAAADAADGEIVTEEAAAAAAAVAPSGYNSDSTEEGEGEGTDCREEVVAAGKHEGGGAVVPTPEAAGASGGGASGEFSFSFFDGNAAETAGVGAQARKEPDDHSCSGSSGDDSDASSEDSSDEDDGGKGGGDADVSAEASGSAPKKRRKARSALTGESKAAAKAKAAAVAYERALQVAEVLA